MTTSKLSAAFLVVLTLSLGACAAPRASAPAPPAKAPPPVKVVKADEGSMIVCGIERPTGSNIPRRICRTREQIERDREAAQAILRAKPGAGRADDD